MPIQFIPKTFDHRTPHSEKLVAEWLEKDPAASQYTVYHSHGLGAHERASTNGDYAGIKPHGEIDFVILVPPAGIVTVEVKGDQITRRDGRWLQQGHGYSQSINDPIQQMVGNQHELMRQLEKKLLLPNDFRALTFAGLVIFPKTENCPNELDIESNEWEIASLAEVKKFKISGCIQRALNRTKEVLGKKNSPPPIGLMSRVKSVIRADFDMPISPILLRQEEERLRLELTEQQYLFLSVVEANGKAFVEGGAGTGKTLLALEFAKREFMQGRRVGLFCYNNLLGAWLKKQCEGIEQIHGAEKFGSMIVGTFQSWMRSTVLEDKIAKELLDQELIDKEQADFWEILNECAPLAVDNLTHKFDTVIIDEMQDFQNPFWLSLVDKSLTGGLKDGRWAFFGDYSRQALFSDGKTNYGADDFKAEIEYYEAYPVKIPLTVNCRNTKRIVDMTCALTSFSWGSLNGLGPKGKRVDRYYYKSPEEQFEKIRSIYCNFIEEKFDPKQIVLLWDSMAGTGDFNEKANLSGLKLCEWSENGPPTDYIASASIQRFKGLEADAIIACNLHGISDLAIQQKLYVAMTRARSRLALVLPHRLKDKIDYQMSEYFGA